ncbi:MAG: hypothetical protein IKP22_06945 [Clostridia bacterium]|nr:hypothetical protein [Clostridia bacterium]
MKNRSRMMIMMLLLTDLVLCAMCIGSFLAMALSRDADGRLSAAGLRSLKYFTVDSNIICGLAALFEAVSLVPVYLGKREDTAVWIRWFRLAGTSSVAMTFFVVMSFLGPTMGYRYMFVGHSLYMHLLSPVLAVVSFLLFRLAGGLERKRFYLGSLPLAIYAVYYVYGVLSAGRKMDWYGFAAWGPVWIAPVFIIILFISCGLSFLLVRFGGGGKDYSS